MTKLQKRVYSLLLRGMLLMLFYRFHEPDGKLEAEHSQLRKDLHDAIMELEKGR